MHWYLWHGRRSDWKFTWKRGEWVIPVLPTHMPVLFHRLDPFIDGFAELFHPPLLGGHTHTGLPTVSRFEVPIGDCSLPLILWLPDDFYRHANLYYSGNGDDAGGVHSKLTIVDDETAIVSSMNFMARSESTNHETGIVAIDRDVIESAKESIIGLQYGHETESACDMHEYQYVRKTLHTAEQERSADSQRAC